LTLPEDSGNTRDELRAHLTDHTIGHDVYYPLAFHQQACFQHLGYEPGDFPVAEKAAASTIAIPIYPDLTNDMQEYVIETFVDFYQ
jgi:dTDP-4-amino-4,6-dideoxygalactose transaminase